MFFWEKYLHEISFAWETACTDSVQRKPFGWLVLLVLWFHITGPQMHSQALIERAAAFDAYVPTVLKQVQEVGVALTVTDKHGHFVNNLTPSDLLILDNDDRVEQITYFESRSNLPLYIALVIDSSDSVAYCFDSERKTAAHFLKTILRPERDSALIVNFNEEATIAQRSTADLHLLQQSLKKIHVGGETAIYDAVSLASQELETIKSDQPSRRVVILITDGDDNRSHVSLDQAAEIALRNEATVFVISTNSASLPDTVADRAMKQLANSTGGVVLRANGDVGYAFSKIEKELRSQYAIAYKPPHASPDGEFHRLTILGSSKVRLFHRMGYFAK